MNESLSPDGEGPAAARRLIVLADSLPLITPAGLPDRTEPRMYPNVAAARLRVATGQPWQVVAHARAGARLADLLQTLRTNENIRERVAGSHAVILAVGSIDTLTAGIPVARLASARRIVPSRLRRLGLRAIYALDPLIVRLRDKKPATPVAAYQAMWREVVQIVRGLAGDDVPLCGLAPSMMAPRFGYAHDFRLAFIEATREVAAEIDLPLVEPSILIEKDLHLLAPDGMHWEYDMHAQIGDAMAEQLLGRINREDETGRAAGFSPETD